MDKIKDFFHDYSDVILGFLIVAAMFMVVYVNLTTIFDESTAAVTQPSDSSALEERGSGDDSDIIVVDLGDPTDWTEGDADGPEDRHESDAEGTETTAEEPVPPEPAAPPTDGQLVTVTIPNGTPGIGIAQILVDHQLIPDTTAFVQSAEALDLSLKLKSGTFQIPAGSTPETMVKIIAGQ